jgi:hypothetical protein
MTLLASQTRFLAEIAADDDVPPSSIGMGIYRNAYRARLIGALESGYERTRRWVGDEAFEAAAAHYILTMPPSSWTLDVFGAQFPDVLAELFAGDPEVAELAWLEWHMQQAFAAPDLPELDAARLGAAGLDEDGWNDLRFTMAAGFVTRPVKHELAELWHGLAPDSAAKPANPPGAGKHLIVWRHALRPCFRLLDSAEFDSLKQLANGATLGAAGQAHEAHEASAEQFGQWLATWLGEGLFADFNYPL